MKKLIITLITITLVQAGAETRARIGKSGPIDILDIKPVKRQLCGVPEIDLDREQAINEYMRQFHPDVYRKMILPPVRKRTFAVGDTATFWVLQDDETGGTSRVQVGAKLVAQGTHTAIWVDTLVLYSSNNISESLAQEYLVLLEETTPAPSVDSSLGVYDLELQYFGEPPNKDGDGIVDFLFSDLYSGVAGYFSPLDQTSQAGSNQRDIVYIDNSSSVSYTAATLSHEFQHLIHYNYDPSELAEFNEGLSEAATIICGGDYISHAYYLRNPSISWKWESDLEHYSMASLFSIYYIEQFGLDVIKQFITLKSGSNPLHGLTAFNTLLTNEGTGMDFAAFLKNWLVANYFDDNTFDSRYGYDMWMPMRAQPMVSYRLANEQSTGNVILGYSGQYIEYTSSADSMEITFMATSLTKPEYVDMEFMDSSKAVNALVDGQTFLVDDADEKIHRVVFLVANGSDLNLTYGYESTGIDISEYSVYDEIAYDDGEPDIFTYDGGSFGWLGFGNGNQSLGWAMRFDPAMPLNQLVEFKVMAGFDQEFSNSSTPADADKDFEVHVWKPVGTNGSVEDVITPFIFSTQRPSLSNDFLVVDLAPYADQLKNYSELYIGIVEDDTIGTYFAMDNTTSENYTYAFNYDGNSKLDSMSNFSVGGASLAGWNYMMRATFFYSDTTQPEFSAGFFQNPVFTDELDLFMLGNSLLGPSKLTATVTQGSDTTVLNTQVLTGNDSILIANQYRLKSSGQLQFRINGSLRYGTLVEDTTFTFNVNYTLAKAGGQLTAGNGDFKLVIPADALKEDVYLIAGEEVATLDQAELVAAREEPESPIFTVSPLGKKLQQPAVVTVVIPEVFRSTDPKKLVVAYWDGKNWREIPTEPGPDPNSLQGYTLNLGHFTVMRQGSGIPMEIDANMLPTEYSLVQNYPNPFNPETVIRYELPVSGQVQLTIYDILGREVITLQHAQMPAGRHRVTWDGKNAAGKQVVSGLYFYQLRVNGFRNTKKMILTR
ncbi:MAG: FlgD immunoglobulin-like domain containing protein [Fidelibacterota bacterium]